MSNRDSPTATSVEFALSLFSEFPIRVSMTAGDSLIPLVTVLTDRILILQFRPVR